MRVPHPGLKSTNLLKSLPMGPQAVCHPGTRLPQKLHSSSAPACKPRVRAVQDVITQYIAGYISLLCSVVVVPFLFYCIYLISSRSSGPKHTRIREIIFHWLYRLLKHSTVGWEFWHYPVPHCCPVPRHHTRTLSLLPPKNPTDRSCTAQHSLAGAILNGVATRADRQ